jgi:hypothetical protein
LGITYHIFDNYGQNNYILLEEGEDDENMTASDTTIRANQHVSSVLCTLFYDFENGMLPNNFLVLRNNGEDHGGLENKLGGGGR